jgi:hypothetical protein
MKLYELPMQPRHSSMKDKHAHPEMKHLHPVMQQFESVTEHPQPRNVAPTVCCPRRSEFARDVSQTATRVTSFASLFAHFFGHANVQNSRRKL